MKNWMKIETETIYGDSRVILYDGDVYDSDEKLNPVVQLADMYLNMAIPSKETGKCDIIVLDKLTADFWLNLVNEQKEKSFKQGSKETTEKVIKKVREMLNSCQTVYEDDKYLITPNVGYLMKDVDDGLDEIEKEFDVEIKK